MSAAATVHSPTHTHSRKHSSTRSARPSTTPRGHRDPTSVGQSQPPHPSPRIRSPQATRDNKTASPSYFGFVVDNQDSIPLDSQPGHHAKQNWSFAPKSRDNGSTSRNVPVESNPDFEAFRRQSQKGSFSLNSAFSTMARPSQERSNSIQTIGSVAESPMSPKAKRPHLEKTHKTADSGSFRTAKLDQPSFFDIPKHHSPLSLSPKHSVEDHNASRLSLPSSEVSLPKFGKAQRSDTVPPSAKDPNPSLVSPQCIAELLEDPDNILVLDLRVYQQYSKSRIQGALNLCIPTTLLKRPTFTTQKLADTFSSARDREKFERWSDCEYIVVYDATSALQKEATTPLNVLKKFAAEGWKGAGFVVKGGFQTFVKLEPKWVDSGPTTSGSGSSTQPLSISPHAADALPVAGGCSMPSSKSAANPFFGNIRQNMDLLDGVGQMPVKKPANMSEQFEKALPSWLRNASLTSDEGHRVSERFLALEKSEQKRMQQALSVKVCYGSPEAESPRQVQVAGIEKGSKNRYNNILPFDHSRVKLQNASTLDCDYVNASHVKAEYSNRKYIATQAPIPATFNDFWRVVWEQNARVIVMLTAESEGGQVKGHAYWRSGEYGPLKLKRMSEHQVPLEPRSNASSSPTSAARPSLGQRRSTTNNLPSDKRSAETVRSPIAETPAITVRTFTLSHSEQPFQPLRQITQLQYSQWPDFGAPQSPTAILNLIEQVNKYVRGSASPKSAVGPNEAAPEGERPIVVHCSAGCGRTGTFCTIDSVIDMLKRQRLDHTQQDDDRMDVDQESWVGRDDEDLVEKAVDDFRHQRLSMVQNLRQFVLCYESILQWVVAQQAEASRSGAAKDRRSYQG